MAFEFPLNGTPENLASKIEEAITKRGGKFTGDAKEGKIEISTPVGGVTVTYKILGETVSVEIVEKPVFVPEEMIKNEILKMM